MSRPTLPPITVTIEGEHDSGKTTLANLLKEMLEENAYAHVTVEDSPPLPAERKDRFSNRFDRNRALRPVHIRVRLAP